jgi:hypothetical protein
VPVLQGWRTAAASTAARTARPLGTTAGDLKVCQFFFTAGDLKVCQFYRDGELLQRPQQPGPHVLSGPLPGI